MVREAEREDFLLITPMSILRATCVPMAWCLLAWSKFSTFRRRCTWVHVSGDLFRTEGVSTVTVSRTDGLSPSGNGSVPSSDRHPRVPIHTSRFVTTHYFIIEILLHYFYHYHDCHFYHLLLCSLEFHWNLFWGLCSSVQAIH
jgi:hypothetical protein